MNQAPENDIKNSILGWLSTLPECFVWPNDSTGIFDPSKGIYRRKNSKFFIRGVSDILGIYKGRPLAIEVKSKIGRVSEHQEFFLKRFELSGGIAIVARSIDDVRNRLIKEQSMVDQKHCAKNEH